MTKNSTTINQLEPC